MITYRSVRDAITGRWISRKGKNPDTSVKEQIHLWRPALRKSAQTAQRLSEEARTEEARDAYLWAAEEFLRLAAK